MKVVFDTNVVASASFRRGKPFDCLAAWAEGKCEAAVRPAVLAKYHETIEELRLKYPNRKSVEWADALAESATLVVANGGSTASRPGTVGAEPRKDSSGGCLGGRGS